jgi:hypothetical protein
VPDVAEIAKQLDLTIEEEELDGFDGCLVRPIGVPIGVIGIRRDIRETSRKHFTVAHEIGHFVLPGHDQADGVCTAKDLNRWTWAQKDLEQEANRFAAELLIPTRIAQPIVKGRGPSLDTLKEMADKFGTSLSATAWRFCELTSAPCAFVWSSNRKVVWSKTSADFGYSIYSHSDIHEGTLASELFDGEWVSAEPQRVPAELWLPSYRTMSGAGLWEQSMRLTNYNAVLSFLWIDKNIDRDDMPELLEELDPDEFTLDRKRWPGKR